VDPLFATGRGASDMDDAPPRPVRKKRKVGQKRTAVEDMDAAATGSQVVENSQRRAVKRKRKVNAAAPADDEQRAEAGDEEPEEVDKDVAAADRKPIPNKPTMFKKDTNFSKLGLANWIVENCSKLGMHYPTEIQASTIPPVVAGRNVAGNSKTGSGKTACYCLPILNALSQDPFGVFALVLLPVRELALQVCENFTALGRNINVQVLEIIGGRDMSTQKRGIAERAHIIVATPGRLADLLRGDPTLKEAFRAMRTLVLDEADQLLTSTFEDPLAEILSALPKKRQTLLFSATLTGSIEKLRSRVPDLVLFDANPEDHSLENMTHEYIFVPNTVQTCYVHHLLKDHFADMSCIIFTPKIEICQMLTTTLEILGFPVAGLHALQSQKKRSANLGKFRSGRATILVATDVACRGLDIPKVAVVINYGLPSFVDTFVHRSGRTARAGRPGLVVSVMTEFDVRKVGPIEERLGRQLALRAVSEEAALKVLSSTAKAQQKADLLLSEMGFEDMVADFRAKRPNRPADGNRRSR